MKYLRNIWSAFSFHFAFFIVQSALPFGAFAQPSAPVGFKVAGYDSHIELKWNKNPENNILGYRVYRQKGESLR